MKRIDIDVDILLELIEKDTIIFNRRTSTKTTVTSGIEFDKDTFEGVGIGDRGNSFSLFFSNNGEISYECIEFYREDIATPSGDTIKVDLTGEQP